MNLNTLFFIRTIATIALLVGGLWLMSRDMTVFAFVCFALGGFLIRLNKKQKDKGTAPRK